MSDGAPWLADAVEAAALDACRKLDPDQCEVVCRGCLRFARAALAAFLRRVPGHVVCVSRGYFKIVLCGTSAKGSVDHAEHLAAAIERLGAPDKPEGGT